MKEGKLDRTGAILEAAAATLPTAAGVSIASAVIEASSSVFLNILATRTLLHSASVDAGTEGGDGGAAGTGAGVAGAGGSGAGAFDLCLESEFISSSSNSEGKRKENKQQ